MISIHYNTVIYMCAWSLQPSCGLEVCRKSQGILSPFPGSPTPITVMRFHRPYKAALLPGPGTSGNVLSQAGQEGVGGLFLRCQTFMAPFRGLATRTPLDLGCLGLLPTLTVLRAFSFLTWPALPNTRRKMTGNGVRGQGDHLE